jgi:copper homeostasis protein
VYEENEIREMHADIAAILALPHAPSVRVGIVTGALRADGNVNVDVTQRLLDACGSTPLTFHRAFDQTRDPLRALDSLMEIGVARILTSGGAATALEGSAALATLHARATNRTTILAGGGIRPHNVVDVVNLTGVHEVHFAATSLRTMPDRDYVIAPLVGQPIPTDSMSCSNPEMINAMVEAVSHTDIELTGLSR